MNIHLRPYLPYGRQVIEEDDIAAVTEALRGDLLTTGPQVDRFEMALARATGAKHAVACSNGTAALYMAARALGLGPGKTVIVPTITFLATASAPYLAGANIVFADVDPRTGLMRPEDLNEAISRAGGRADAVFNVHLNGQCGALEDIADLARARGLSIVEDCCHALGSSYLAKDGTLHSIGSNYAADISVFSFHPVKTIAMGEGGAVTTNDAEMVERLRLARNHGMIRTAANFVNREDAFNESGEPHPWYYEMAAPHFNWRASDIQCALGTSQLKKLERFVSRRREVAALYDEAFSGMTGPLKPIARTRSCLPAWHLYVAQIDFGAAGISRGTLMRMLAAEGIGTQVHYFPVHRQPYYAGLFGAAQLPGADEYYRKAISLPLSAMMTDNDAHRVVRALCRHLSIH